MEIPELLCSASLRQGISDRGTHLCVRCGGS